ncbi:zinc-dependent metalloprotease [Mariniblastus sp.]|nr:zinc-dependent metalloprotease [Mariniblastus sp.]
MKILLIWLALAGSCFAIQEGGGKGVDEDRKLAEIHEYTHSMQRFDGYLSFFWDVQEGKIFLEIERPGEELLYVHSLATGLGSNPVGLDRGQLGDQKVVRFTRVGPKVFMIQRNLRFRAKTENQLERRAVEQSFAQSVVWGGKVVAETDGRFLTDITDLLLSDMHGVVETLKSTEQGDFSLDQKRSAVFLPRCKSFPDNTELESTLTFASKKPGKYVRQTTPSPKSVTLRQHHSFVRLPDDQYLPRTYDVRSPSMFITFSDYATPLEQSLEKRWIMRHRLVKKEPNAILSEPVDPIVYYVDAGAPKQIQDALLEGASWWNDAFEAAGFKNAFQVKLLPPNADPLDVRYNVIQWVHRSTRGWSYGGSVVDPRTGEILKGHVSLGSLRVRQDQLLVNALDPTPPNLHCACCGVGGIVEESTLADLAVGGNALEVSLARIRQLSAHEVGHTIGFVHNFAASTYGDRASVMDYPAPRVNISDQGQLDLSDAYAVGIGEWDKVSVKFAYSQYADAEREKMGLKKILDDAAKAKMIFISDSDARPAGAAHPMANLWDNGTDPLEQLEHVMQVRRIALDQFDARNLPAGTTTADIAQYLTPIYLHHRYQLQAAGKLIGGYDYSYGYAGGGVGNQISDNLPIAQANQAAAISQLLKTLQPSELLIKKVVRQSISPRPYSTIRDPEIFPGQTGRVFDSMAAAKVAANLTLNELLQHERLARLARQAEMPQDLTPVRLINLVVDETFDATKRQANFQLSQVVMEAVVDHLLVLADNSNAGVNVRLAAFSGLKYVLTKQPATGNQLDFKFFELQNWRINRFLERPYSVLPDSKQLKVPPGSPIGSNL